MCGRFTLREKGEAIQNAFELSAIPELNPRYNIAPTQTIVTIVKDKDQEQNQLKWMRWGLVPSWAKDPKIGYKLINARAETLTEKPAFRSAFKKRRCLIVADGFYEWKQEGKHKQPYYFELDNHQLFAFAGLWETWVSDSSEIINSCTIITTEAVELMKPIHDRMPVILPFDSYNLWLDNELKSTEALLPLLEPNNNINMIFKPVSQLVNKPSNDVINCIEESRL